MRMRLKNDRTRVHHLSPLAPLIAQRAHLIKTTVGRRQSVCLWQRPLAGSLSSSVHVDDEPLPSRPVIEARWGGKRFASKQILLKEHAQGFHGWLIKGSEKAGQG